MKQKFTKKENPHKLLGIKCKLNKKQKHPTVFFVHPRIARKCIRNLDLRVQVHPGELLDS